LGPASSAHAVKGKRDVYWSDKRAYQLTPIYDGEKLEPGNVVPGPAIVELATTTILVPHDCELKIDEYGFFVI
jgi:N-methylhydantoinase A